MRLSLAEARAAVLAMLPEQGEMEYRDLHAQVTQSGQPELLAALGGMLREKAFTQRVTYSEEGIRHLVRRKGV